MKIIGVLKEKMLKIMVRQLNADKNSKIILFKNKLLKFIIIPSYDYVSSGLR